MMLLLPKNRTTNRPVVCICWRGRKGTLVFAARHCLKLSFTLKCSNAFGRLLGCLALVLLFSVRAMMRRCVGVSGEWCFYPTNPTYRASLLVTTLNVTIVLLINRSLFSGEVWLQLLRRRDT